MPPNVVTLPTGVLYESDSETAAIPTGAQDVTPSAAIPGDHHAEGKTNPTKEPLKIVWRNVIMFIYLHLLSIYAVYLMFTSAKWASTLFAIFLYQLGGLGITAGAHRLWAHKSYKAKMPLRVFLTFANTLAYQNSVIEWARDHRVHHKYSETDADPHNATRGFFFAHIGWLLCRKHPEVKAKGSKIDLSDLYADPILAFQKKYYYFLMPIVSLVLPTIIPMYFWNESFYNAVSLNVFRYVFTLNGTWLVNSAAHLWGTKPYDRFINPVENLSVAIFAMGEGWHNYHHTFPWDYKTSELGQYHKNFTAAFIDSMASIGQAYDLKSVSEEIVRKRVERTGDGSHELWGWGDEDQSKEERDAAVVTHRLKKE